MAQSLVLSWHIASIGKISGLEGISMASKKSLWYTDVVLATFERSGNQLIGFVMANYAH